MTINEHKPCGARIRRAQTFGGLPHYFDALGVTLLSVCPRCGKSIKEQDLRYVSVYTAPRAAR